jgi:hypothetical protein
MASVFIEPIKPLISGIIHLHKAHLCDDNVTGVIRAELEERGVLERFSIILAHIRTN